jgi:hypothetical protein
MTQNANQTPRIVREDGTIEDLDVAALANAEADISFWYAEPMRSDDGEVSSPDPGLWTRIATFCRTRLLCLHS